MLETKATSKATLSSLTALLILGLDCELDPMEGVLTSGLNKSTLLFYTYCTSADSDIILDQNPCLVGFHSP